jgi:HD-like signal output (HDOD) protein
MVNGQQQTQITAVLRELHAQMIELWETHFDDPTLAAALARRWGRAGTGEKG